MMRKGSGAAGPAPATEPYNTPHRRRLQNQGPGDAAINQVILSLENDWRLGLRIRGVGWSPTRSSTKDTADKIYGLVQRLHWSGPPTLSQAIANFNELAPQFKHSERLDLLWKTLSSKAKPYAISRAGTPKNDPPKSLKSSIPGESVTFLMCNARNRRDFGVPADYSTCMIHHVDILRSLYPALSVPRSEIS